MLRHTFTAQNQIKQFTCMDCKKRKTCMKVKNYRTINRNEKRELCYNFERIPHGRPKVTIPEDDCRELIHQIMISKLSAKTIQRNYIMDWILPYSHIDSEEPTFSECEIFIKVLDVFNEHVFEFREMYSNCRKDLNDLIQTIIRVEGNKVMVYIEKEEDTASSIRLLRKKIEDVIENSNFHLEYKSYEEILDKEIPEVREEITE